jgi:tripartite-type tricarboxylate transporter receptor subunit TctC
MTGATRRGALVRLLALAAAGTAGAQAVGRPLRILCPVPAGGPPDRVARHYAARLTVPWAGPPIVENRPGGGGIVAVAALQQARADATTWLLGHSGLVTMLPFAHARLPYDPAADLVPVSLAAETGFGFAAGPAVPRAVERVADFAEWARRHPREANIAYAGVATPLHVLAVMLMREAQFTAEPVGYSGGPQIVGDLLGRRVAAAVLPEGLLRPLHQDGRLRVLATAGRERSEVLADVPTLLEQGFGRLVVRDWFGFFVPQGVAPEQVAQASAAVRAVAGDPAFAAALRADGWKPLGSTAAAMQERIEAERPWWREAIATSGVKAE